MRKILAAFVAVLLTSTAFAQISTTPGALSTNAPILAPVPTVATTTSSTPTSILTMLEGYLVNNDPTYNGWQSNHFDIWEGAVFANVNGTPGASSVGNDLGLEVPFWRSATKDYGFHVESITRFEQLFGDVHSQAVGIGYDYNIHQIQLSGGVDLETTFANNAWRAVPFLEFKKASTTLYGLAPFLRYEFPVQKNPGAGRVIVGLQLPF